MCAEGTSTFISISTLSKSRFRNKVCESESLVTLEEQSTNYALGLTSNPRLSISAFALIIFLNADPSSLSWPISSASESSLNSFWSVFNIWLYKLVGSSPTSIKLRLPTKLEIESFLGKIDIS